jgi:hypothetical protein
MEKQLEALKQTFSEELDQTRSIDEIEPMRVKYLGRKGPSPPSSARWEACPPRSAPA